MMKTATHRGGRLPNCSRPLWPARHTARLKSRTRYTVRRPPPAPLPMTAAVPPATDQPEPVRYEDALSELERLVQAMEGSQMPLDGLLDSYRRGAQLLELCRSRLQAVEDQVKVLEDGQLKDWAGA